MLTRRSLLAGTAAAGFLADGTARPNFVFIHADDHAGYVMGCDGNAMAQTPNLDALAGQGVRFARHYCNSPLCTPSRQSILTGEMPSTCGVTLLSTSLAPGAQTLATQLRSVGYATSVYGKMHFNSPSYPGMHGFEELILETDLERAMGSGVKRRPIPPGSRVKPPWRPFVDPARIWLNADKLPNGAYDDNMAGTYLAKHTAEFFAKHRSDPFALWVSFLEPHSPYYFPIEYADKYSPEQFPAPPVSPGDRAQIPLCMVPLTDRDKQGIIASYYTSVSFLDRNIGTIISALDRLGLAENTLVVYLPDHGYLLGQHGRFEKNCGYDEALRVPLIMRWPGRIKAGGVVRDFTESIDVAPTILDLLGAPRLPVEHGQSLRPYLVGRRPAAPRDHIFSQYLNNEEAYIRTDRYKFIYCSGSRKRTDRMEPAGDPTPGRYVRLYDLHTDPGEFTDLSGLRSSGRLVAEFERMILDRFLRTHPEAHTAPRSGTVRDKIDFFLAPRDA